MTQQNPFMSQRHPGSPDSDFHNKGGALTFLNTLSSRGLPGRSTGTSPMCWRQVFKVPALILKSSGACLLEPVQLIVRHQLQEDWVSWVTTATSCCYSYTFICLYSVKRRFSHRRTNIESSALDLRIEMWMFTFQTVWKNDVHVVVVHIVVVVVHDVIQPVHAHISETWAPQPSSAPEARLLVSWCDVLWET